MTDPTPDLASMVEELRRLLAKTTPGPWEVDTERNEDGQYGSGQNIGTGYDDFLIGADARGKWVTLLSTYTAPAPITPSAE